MKLIKADGTETDVGVPTMEEAQKYVGGWVESFRFSQSSIILMNEDGRHLKLPINPTASVLARTQIVGDVLIAKIGELK